MLNARFVAAVRTALKPSSGDKYSTSAALTVPFQSCQSSISQVANETSQLFEFVRLQCWFAGCIADIRRQKLCFPYRKGKAWHAWAVPSHI